MSCPDCVEYKDELFRMCAELTSHVGSPESFSQMSSAYLRLDPWNVNGFISRDKVMQLAITNNNTKTASQRLLKKGWEGCNKIVDTEDYQVLSLLMPSSLELARICRCMWYVLLLSIC